MNVTSPCSSCIDCVTRFSVAVSSELVAMTGFPLGANTALVKAVETAEAVKNGATEVDMVANIGALKELKEELGLE